MASIVHTVVNTGDTLFSLTDEKREMVDEV